MRLWRSLLVLMLAGWFLSRLVSVHLPSPSTNARKGSAGGPLAGRGACPPSPFQPHWLHGGECPPTKGNGSFLAVITYFRQETMTVCEWLDHYLWQGVDHFFLVDNNSTDNPLAILSPYIRCGVVTYRSRPEPYGQLKYMKWAFQEAQAQSYTWIINADMDEFWFATQPNFTLRYELASTHDFAQADMIVARWWMFGTSGADRQPASVRQANVHRWAKLHRDKWIARAETINASKIYIHYFPWITPRGARVIKDLKGRLRLHHYPLQSREFYEKIKMTRGDSYRPGKVRNWTVFEEDNRRATVEDRTLADLVAQAVLVTPPPVVQSSMSQ